MPQFLICFPPTWARCPLFFHYLMCPVGSQSCTILQVCVCIVGDNFYCTLSTDSQWIQSNILVVSYISVYNILALVPCGERHEYHLRSGTQSTYSVSSAWPASLRTIDPTEPVPERPPLENLLIHVEYTRDPTSFRGPMQARRPSGPESHGPPVPRPHEGQTANVLVALQST